MSGDAPRRFGGRPTAVAAALLETAILDAATASFLAEGYAATTIEAVARSCSVAKRTIYVRWSGKPALFRAVLERLMTKWLSIAGDWGDASCLETTLNMAAARVLAVALTPEAVALQRLLIGESSRFPELHVMMIHAGAGEGTARIAAVLDRAIASRTLPPQDTTFAAEQFLHLIVAGPQRRSLGLGQKLDEKQVANWRKSTVALFLNGVKAYSC